MSIINVTFGLLTLVLQTVCQMNVRMNVQNPPVLAL